MDVLVNHVGYDTRPEERGRSVRAVVQCDGGESFPDAVVLRESDGRGIARFPAGEAFAVDGWIDRRFAVVEVDAPEGGPYRLSAESGDSFAVSAPFRIGSAVVASGIVSDLLFGLRSFRSDGAGDEADRSVPFFGDRSGRVDVHGGWYDASGDTSKYLSHLGYAECMSPQQTPLVAWALMDALECLEGSRFPVGERLRLRFREEAEWGTDFLLRMQDPEGYFYTTVFDRWTKDLGARRICAYSGVDGELNENYRAGYRQGGGMAIAALARASRQGGVERSGGGNPLEAAVRGWRHLEEHNAEYLENGRENIIDDTCALLAAVELIRTGVEEAREAAISRAASLCGRWMPDEGFFRADSKGRRSWFHASDEALPLVALMRAVETGAVAGNDAEKALAVVRQAMDAELSRATDVANPFLHPRRVVRLPGKPDAIRFFYPHENPSGYWWQGENARLASWSAAFRRWGRLRPEKVRDDDERFAEAQISWILGMNPFDACMLRGVGRNNPEYEWDHFNVPGGVSNGITSGFSDEDDIAFMPAEAMGSGDHSWRWGEQWIPHAAWLLLAAAWSVPPA